MIDESVDAVIVGVAGIGGDMVGIVMGSVDVDSVDVDVDSVDVDVDGVDVDVDGMDVDVDVDGVDGDVILDTSGYMLDCTASDEIGGKGDTERELGSGISDGSALVTVAVVVPIEVRELQDERLERDVEGVIG